MSTIRARLALSVSLLVLLLPAIAGAQTKLLSATPVTSGSRARAVALPGV